MIEVETTNINADSLSCVQLFVFLVYFPSCSLLFSCLLTFWIPRFSITGSKVQATLRLSDNECMSTQGDVWYMYKEKLKEALYIEFADRTTQLAVCKDPSHLRMKVN